MPNTTFQFCIAFYSVGFSLTYLPGSGDAAQTVEDGTRHAAEAVHDRADRAGERVKDGVQATYKFVEDETFAGKTKVRNTAGFAQDKVSESVYKAGDSASLLSQSVQESLRAAKSKAAETAASTQERFSAAKSKAAETAASAQESFIAAKSKAAETAASAYGDAAHRLKDVSEQVADIVRSRATEAAHVLPNVGQGLAYETLDTDDVEEPGFLSKGSDLVEGAQDTAENYGNIAKEKVRSALTTMSVVLQWERASR